VANLNGVQWHISVVQAGDYRVVAEIGGRWTQLSAGHFPQSIASFSVAGATQFEMLVDRRPYEPVTPVEIVETRVSCDGWTGSGSPIDTEKRLTKEGQVPVALDFSSNH